MFTREKTVVTTSGVGGGKREKGAETQTKYRETVVDENEAYAVKSMRPPDRVPLTPSRTEWNMSPDIIDRY